MSLDEPRLLKPPVARAAYSDRTAWMMAEMSRLAYLAFELGDDGLRELARGLAENSDAEAIVGELMGIQHRIAQLRTESRGELIAALLPAEFELAAVFDEGGTQAFLATRPADRMAVLAFRGTEKNYKDIKTDLKARFYRERGGVKIHNGFREAFGCVEKQIKVALEDIKDYNLYITGHSLGGALALMAARSLNSDKIAACYTFGSPRVGTSEFGDPIKSPIYRIVNAADSVPRVPPSWGIDVLTGIAYVLPVPYLRKAAISICSSLRGYCHHGDMRYLTDCKDDFSDLRLLANPNVFRRGVRFLKRVGKNWRAVYEDHGIAEYCSKLKAYAFSRLDGTEDESSRTEWVGKAKYSETKEQEAVASDSF